MFCVVVVVVFGLSRFITSIDWTTELRYIAIRYIYCIAFQTPENSRRRRFYEKIGHSGGFRVVSLFVCVPWELFLRCAFVLKTHITYHIPYTFHTDISYTTTDAEDRVSIALRIIYLLFGCLALRAFSESITFYNILYMLIIHSAFGRQNDPYIDLSMVNNTH